jgi:hypothetical protein
MCHNQIRAHHGLAGQNINSLTRNIYMVCRITTRTRREFTDLQHRNGSLFMQLLRGRPFILRGNGQFASLEDMRDAFEQNADAIRAWWKSNMPSGTRAYSELLFSILPKLKINITMPALPYSSKEAMPGAWPHKLFHCDESQPAFLYRNNIISSAEYTSAVSQQQQPEHFARA